MRWKTSSKSIVSTQEHVAEAPTGERFNLEPPVAVFDDNPPVVVIRDDLAVVSHTPPPAVHQVGSRNVAMTPYGGSLAAVSTELGDNW